MARNARNDVTPERLQERAAQYGTGTGIGSQVSTIQFRETCGHCGARRIDNQIGLEPTLAEHLDKLVEVLEEVRRVLRPDGVLFLNYGDVYASQGGAHNGRTDNQRGVGAKRVHENGGGDHGARTPPEGLKPKDNCLIPERLSVALQEAGWWVRDRIVWHKPNPMPSSVTDRCTPSYELVYMLTRSARYWWDAEAIKEPVIWADDKREGERIEYGGKRNGKAGTGQKSFVSIDAGGRNCRNVWTIPTAPLKHVASYGSYRIGSPDCSVHGCRDGLARVLRGDALQAVSDPPRSLGIYDHPELGQEGAVYAIREDQTEFLLDLSSAISHSNQIRKMAVELGLDGFSDDKPADHIACKKHYDRSDAKFARIPESSILPGVSVDEPGSDPSGQIPSRILGIATFQDPPDGCTCQHTGKVEKRQDHFASFPPRLVERALLAACPEKVCAECGAGWVRETESTFHPQPDVSLERGIKSAEGVDPSNGWAGFPRGTTERKTLGWSPSCTCQADTAAGTCLDPFGGSGTVGLVADRMCRNAILIELSKDYCDMAEKRIRGDAGLFANVELTA